MKDKILKIVLIAVIAILVIALVIFGCVKLFEKNPADSVKGLVESLSAGDYTKAAEYSVDGSITSLELGSKEDGKDMINLFVKNLSADVKDVSKKKEDAVVKVNITNKDVKTILQNYMQKAMEIAFTNLNGSMTQEDMETQLLDYLKTQFESQEIQNVTTSVDVNLKKVDGKWLVVIDEKLRDAILPGMMELANTVKQTNTNQTVEQPAE